MMHLTLGAYTASVPCRRSDDGHLCRKEVHTLGRQWPCLWQPCTAIRKCGRCICCTCMGDGNHCSHYQDNGSSMARWHKGHSKGGRGWSGPCTARRKGICNWIGHKYYLSFLLHFFRARALAKNAEFASEGFLLSEQMFIIIKLVITFSMGAPAGFLSMRWSFEKAMGPAYRTMCLK